MSISYLGYKSISSSVESKSCVIVLDGLIILCMSSCMPAVRSGNTLDDCCTSSGFVNDIMLSMYADGGFHRTSCVQLLDLNKGKKGLNTCILTCTLLFQSRPWQVYCSNIWWYKTTLLMKHGKWNIGNAENTFTK